MAKKSRRGRRRKPGKRTTVESSNQTKSNDSKTTRTDAAEQFQQEYAYVLKDLRQILVLAVAMFALLIALNFLLQLV